MAHIMSDRILANYLRVQRRKSGLSQHEVGQLLGYKRSWQVSRHERSRTAPPLLAALAYEAVFRTPVSALFAGMKVTVAQVVEGNITELEKDLENRTGKGRLAGGTAHKLRWLKERRTLA